MKTCTIYHCSRGYYAKGFCEGHYKRHKKGMDMDIPFRTESRKATIKGGVAKVPLGVGAKDGYFVIDKNLSELVENHKWSLSVRGYPVASVGGRLCNAHQLIKGRAPKGKVIDHINRDKMDNRQSNLRFTSQKTNTHNSSMYTTNTSGHRGVTYDKRNNKWVAQAFFEGKMCYGGRFEKIEDAVKARKKLEEAYKFNQ